MKTGCFRPTDIATDLPKYLFQAAILNDRLDVVEYLLETLNRVDLLSFDHDNAKGPAPWPSALALAASSGNVELLGRILSVNFQNRREKRHEALGAAIATGQLDTVAFIMDPRWGPVDFIDSSHCVEENLISGVLNSPHVDFFPRLFALFDSHKTREYPIEIHEPEARKFVSTFATGSPQRVDIIEYLYNNRRMFPDDLEDVIWSYAARRAVDGGNEKIVRFLLDRGVGLDTASGNTLKQAVITGRFDIVQILFEYGAQITCRQSGDLWRLGPAMSLLDRAIKTENEHLCRFLVDKGAECDLQALTDAAEHGKEFMVRIFLERGVVATPELVEQARMRRYYNIAELLQGSLDKGSK